MCGFSDDAVPIKATDIEEVGATPITENQRVGLTFVGSTMLVKPENWDFLTLDEQKNWIACFGNPSGGCAARRETLGLSSDQVPFVPHPAKRVSVDGQLVPVHLAWDLWDPVRQDEWLVNQLGLEPDFTEVVVGEIREINAAIGSAATAVEVGALACGLACAPAVGVAELVATGSDFVAAADACILQQEGCGSAIAVLSVPFVTSGTVRAAQETAGAVAGNFEDVIPKINTGFRLFREWVDLLINESEFERR